MLRIGKRGVTGHFSDYFRTSSFKSETFMHWSCSLVISGIRFYSHSLRKDSARLSQVLFIDSVDRLAFHRPTPHLSCQKCPKTVLVPKEGVPMNSLWKNEGTLTKFAWDMAERVPRLLRAIGPPLSLGYHDAMHTAPLRKNCGHRGMYNCLYYSKIESSKSSKPSTDDFKPPLLTRPSQFRRKRSRMKGHIAT